MGIRKRRSLISALHEIKSQQNDRSVVQRSECLTLQCSGRLQKFRKIFVALGQISWFSRFQFHIFSAKLHYTDSGYGHVVQQQPRTSSQQVLDVVQHVRRRLNLLYNILPATDMLYNTVHNGRAHNNSATCYTTNSPPTDKNLSHLNILTCRDVGLWHCDVANLLYNKL